MTKATPLLVCLLFAALPLLAKEAPILIKPLLEGKVTKNIKLLGELSQLQLDWEGYMEKAHRGIFKPSNPMLNIKNGFIRVDAIATNNASALKAKLLALGMRKISVYGKYISGDFLVSSLGKAEKLSELRSMRLVHVATRVAPKKRSNNFATQQTYQNEVQSTQK